MESSGRFHGETEAGIESLAAVAQYEHCSVFREERAEEIEFRAAILRLVS